MAEAIPTCRNLTCKPQETGKCELGKDPLESCSEYRSEEVALDYGEDDDDRSEPTEHKLPELRANGLITPADLWPFLKSVGATKIALVGEVRSGKTTLIAALYESFCQGMFADYKFRASRTLTAFARVHHSALDKSGREFPVVPRTSQKDGLGYFHLNVTSDCWGSQHLLIAERSGEDYRKARSETSLIATLDELKLADRVCFLLDCARLTNSDTKHAYRRNFKQQISALLDNNAFRPNVKLQIVSTKIDKLAPSGQSVPDVSELEDYESTVIEHFSRSNVTIECHHVCALPRSNYRVGLVGLENLFTEWLGGPRNEFRPLRARQAARQIDRIMEYWGLDAVG